MDGADDDGRYPLHRHRGHRRPPTTYPSSSSHRPTFKARLLDSAPPPPSHRFRYNPGDFDDEDDDEDGDRGFGRRDGRRFAGYVEAEEEGFDDDDDEEEEEEEEEEQEERRYFGQIPQKKRRIDRLAGHGYEFAPRPKPAPPPPEPPRSSPGEWSEQATFVLLDVWGDRFLQMGRKSLRADEWGEVARKVSQASRVPRSEAQCRHRLDTLKRRYKKEKVRMAETGSSSCKWVFFKKMDMLMSPPPQQVRHTGLPCGLDSGEYIFMNPRVYLNKADGMDEMSDSPGNSEFLDDDDDDEDDEDDDDLDDAGEDGYLVSGKGVGEQGVSCDPAAYRMLADSVRKFGEIYERIENSKRQQMMELERMRMDFHRDLEVQKRQILERAETEIANIRDEGDEEDEEADLSMENGSG